MFDVYEGCPYGNTLHRTARVAMLKEAIDVATKQGFNKRYNYYVLPSGNIEFINKSDIDKDYTYFMKAAVSSVIYAENRSFILDRIKYVTGQFPPGAKIWSVRNNRFGYIKTIHTSIDNGWMYICIYPDGIIEDIDVEFHKDLCLADVALENQKILEEAKKQERGPGLIKRILTKLFKRS